MKDLLLETGESLEEFVKNLIHNRIVQQNKKYAINFGIVIANKGYYVDNLKIKESK